jgi:hypothetical protein
MTHWTTLLERTHAWWRRRTPPSEWHTPVLSLQQPAPNVPVPYLSFYKYLQNRYASSVVLTFEQIESLLGFALPAPAWSERGWWTSGAEYLDRHSDAWRMASRTATPNLRARTVTFERVESVT